MKENKVAVVTGAAQGLGRSFALRLASDHFAVAALDVDDPKVGETCSIINEAGGTSKAYTIDLADVVQIDPVVERIESELGPIQVLVNNAGRVKVQPLLEVTESDWDAIMDVNLKGLFFMLQAVGRRMVRRSSGTIINISSISGRSARPKQVIYGASKAAVMHVTKSAAAAFGPFNVRVNAICPGTVETPMWEQVKRERTPEEVKHILKSIPLGRTAEAAEVAEVIAFLASERASYINGQSINVCGGIEMD